MLGEGRTVEEASRTLTRQTLKLGSQLKTDANIGDQETQGYWKFIKMILGHQLILYDVARSASSL
jgi:hypothetical protein